jgi:hypothetical protein
LEREYNRKEIEFVPIKIDEVEDKTCNCTNFKEEDPSPALETSRTESALKVYKGRDGNSRSNR